MNINRLIDLNKLKFDKFYKAEDNHQNYYQENFINYSHSIVAGGFDEMS